MGVVAGPCAVVPARLTLLSKAGGGDADNSDVIEDDLETGSGVNSNALAACACCSSAA